MLRQFMEVVAWIYFRFTDIFIGIPISLISTFKRRNRCPPLKNDLLYLPAATLANNIRRKLLTSESVVKAYIERIKEVNPIINAVVDDRFGSAIEEAKHADQIVAADNFSVEELEKRYPLLGVPITIKESIAVAGLSHSAGLSCSNRGKAAEDADVTKLVKEAGAIPIAVSNTPELCLNYETYNNVTGRTLNPYDTRRTPGGSSGGEASLLGSAASVIGLGSDIGGSLRLPAHYCGIWGHKPTPGLVPLNGHFPDCTNREKWESVFTLGPMCRYAVDLPLLLHVMTKSSKRELLGLDTKVDFSKLKFFYMETNESWLSHSVDQEIVSAIRSVVNHFAVSHKAYTQKLHLRELKNSFVQSTLTLFATDGVDDVLNKNERKSILMEFLRYMFCSSRYFLFSILFIIFNRSIRRHKLTRLMEQLSAVKQKFQDMLGENGVFIYPTFPKPAHFHNQFLAKLSDICYMSVFNSLGLPVTNCPIGLNRNGLPIGVQVVAKQNCDRLSLAVAQEIEKAFGGWVPPNKMQMHEV